MAPAAAANTMGRRDVSRGPESLRHFSIAHLIALVLDRTHDRVVAVIADDGHAIWAKWEGVFPDFFGQATARVNGDDLTGDALHLTGSLLFRLRGPKWWDGCMASVRRTS